MEIKKVQRLAVFDLDDTIYVGNSHFSILNDYYHTKFFTSVPMRMLGKLFPSLRLQLINYFYHRIPQSVRRTYTMPCRGDVMALIHQQRVCGAEIVIASNAPKDLLYAASKKFQIPIISAGVGEKLFRIKKSFDYQTLFVCTDNKTDLDLLSAADYAVVTCKRKNKDFFQKRLPNKNITFSYQDDWVKDR